jgi:1-acyl-sn-glycerol-3-phosphate acyltransferase
MFDSFFHFNYTVPSLIAKADVEKILFIGNIAKGVQAIFVDRLNKDNKRKTMEEMKRRSEIPEYPPILIYPEATTTNLTCLGKI